MWRLMVADGGFDVPHHVMHAFTRWSIPLRRSCALAEVQFGTSWQSYCRRGGSIGRGGRSRSSPAQQQRAEREGPEDGGPTLTQGQRLIEQKAAEQRE